MALEEGGFFIFNAQPRQGLEPRVDGLGFRVEGLGFRVEGLGVRV